ncbi:MAG: TfoX/Sxy family DNA transformation protein [Bdellovibrionales bacterium]|nr:TfoX/Sxy family DNA transformation protein [Bdellovibrionales bacterium]
MKISNNQVVNVFNGYPSAFRKKLKELRKLILETSKDLPETEGIEETLKWGEPSYQPKKKNVGTTVRIHWLKSKPEQYGIFFNCQTTLIAQFKKKYPGLFKYEGKRAIVFTLEDKVPDLELRNCIAMALSYHLRPKKVQQNKAGTPIKEARNLGPNSEVELKSIGINSLEEIIETGWEEVFLKLIEHYPHRLNLNMATALIGAIENCSWREIPNPLKQQAKFLIAKIKRGGL